MRNTHTFLFTSVHILLFFEYFIKDFEDLDLQECEGVNMTDAWLSQVCNERKNYFEDQRKANKVMIKRYTKGTKLLSAMLEKLYIFSIWNRNLEKEKNS